MPNSDRRGNREKIVTSIAMVVLAELTTGQRRQWCAPQLRRQDQVGVMRAEEFVDPTRAGQIVFGGIDQLSRLSAQTRGLTCLAAPRRCRVWGHGLPWLTNGVNARSWRCPSAFSQVCAWCCYPIKDCVVVPYRLRLGAQMKWAGCNWRVVALRRWFRGCACLMLRVIN